MTPIAPLDWDLYCRDHRTHIAVILRYIVYINIEFYMKYIYISKSKHNTVLTTSDRITYES